MSEVIEIKLVDTNVHTRWPCSICDGCTDKVPVLAEGEGWRVCETCLREGDIDKLLSEKADRLIESANRAPARAQEIRSYIGRMKVPSYAEWQEACYRDEAHDILGAYLDGGTPIKSIADLDASIESHEKQWKATWKTAGEFPPHYTDPAFWRPLVTQADIDEFWAWREKVVAVIPATRPVDARLLESFEKEVGF